MDPFLLFKERAVHWLVSDMFLRHLPGRYSRTGGAIFPASIRRRNKSAQLDGKPLAGYLESLCSYYTFYLIDKFGISIQASQICLFVFLFATAAGTLAGVLPDLGKRGFV